MVPVSDDSQRERLESIRQLVLSEVNVKELKVVGSDAGVLVKRVKPDFKKLGPKFGKNMTAVAAALTALDTKAITEFEKAGHTAISLPDGSEGTVELADVEIFSEDIPGWTTRRTRCRSGLHASSSSTIPAARTAE